MGARYVWGKYTVGTKYKEKKNGTVTSVYGNNSNFYLGTAYTFSADTGLYTLQNAILLERDTSARSYKHCIPGSKSGATLYSYSGQYNYRWSEQHIYDSRPYTFVADGSSTGANLTKRIRVTEQVPGEKIGDISSTSSSAFPQNGVQGSNWYTYQGQDNIDPSAVSIPAAIASGQRITITVTPGSSKVYGGTVSYQYQVKLDSGAWQTVATTTATTQTYTVPVSTQSIQARVRAQDNMGFTSATYVASAAVTVVGTPASITVPSQIMEGQNIPISWSAVALATNYILERNADSAGWEQIYSGAETSYTDTPGDWTTVQYRVQAGANDVYGAYNTSASIPIIPASTLVISGTDGDLGILIKDVPYTVSSDTGNPITLERYVNGNLVNKITVQSGFAYSVPVLELPTGTGTIKLVCSVNTSTGGPVTATRIWGYTKSVVSFPNEGAPAVVTKEGKIAFPISLAECIKVPVNLGGSLDKALELIFPLLNTAVMETGSYEGTGAFGSNNPNKLTFDFNVEIVIISGSDGSLTISNKEPSGGQSDGYIEGQEVTWYSTSAAKQFNVQGEIYSYWAVGKVVS